MTQGIGKSWLYDNWSYAGVVAGFFLLALVPLLWNSWSPALLVTLVQLPAYMIHQVEEYYHDHFRIFMNKTLGNGNEVLTQDFVLVVNLGGVWGTDLAALYMAYFLHQGFGLIAIYLPIVNALSHIAFALVFRSYNPGLITAVTVLLPAGCCGWWILVRSGLCSIQDHAWGLGIALTIHACIAGLLGRRANRFRHSN